MSVDVRENDDSSVDLPVAAREVDAGPLGVLPRFSARHVALQSRLLRLNDDVGLGAVVGWLREPLREALRLGEPDAIWKPSGLRRAGLVAQLTWPRLRTRLAIGIETTLSHAIVDRLLGFERLPEEHRLALTPVEWGILTYVVAECLKRLKGQPAGPFGAWDLEIDRVGPDPFDLDSLGRVVTIRWPVSLGDASGAIRLWLPEILVARWLQADPPPPTFDFERTARMNELTGTWVAEAGTIRLPRGLKTLRVNGILPLIDSRLQGTAQSPTGAVNLVARASDRSVACQFRAEPAPFTGGGRLVLTSPIQPVPLPREAHPVDVNPTPSTAPSTPDFGGDVPITLVVELGRVQLSVRRLADLKPGDVIELGRHSREPVELTSGGRLVARGELVQIDTELGVRVTNLFL